jgi:hypothetical protein
MKKLLILALICILLMLNFNISSSAIRVYRTSKIDTIIEYDKKNDKVKEAFEFSDLKPGDILFLFTDYLDLWNGDAGHTLLFRNYNEKTDKYEFIQSGGIIVDIFPMSEWLIDNFIWSFYRVKSASETQIQNALEFAESQLGRAFQHPYINKSYDPNNELDPNSDEWYCSELVWAAYYNCNHSVSEGIFGEGIDIDFNGWELVGEEKYPTVLPGDIIKDDDVEELGAAKDRTRTYSFITGSYFSTFKLLNLIQLFLLSTNIL